MSTPTHLDLHGALQHHPLFPLADQQALKILAAASSDGTRGDMHISTGARFVSGVNKLPAMRKRQRTAGQSKYDALYALFTKTVYYRAAKKAKTLDAKGFLVDVDGAGDLINGCYEAGLLLGLAFGLRLRGAA